MAIGMSLASFSKMDDHYNVCKWDCETPQEILAWINKQPKDGGSSGSSAPAAPAKPAPAKQASSAAPNAAADAAKKNDSGKIMMGNSKLTLAEQLAA